MSNPLESIINIIKTSIDNIDEPKTPLHVIEVGDCWTYLTLLKEFVRYDEVALNTSTDDEVLEALKDAVKICESHINKVTNFMIEEGIPLPETSAAKPVSEPNDIPLGVKLTDDEIMNGMAFKVVTCSQACAKGQAEAIRNDVAIMWVQFFYEWVVFGGTLKTLMRKRGWIKVPPYYYAPGTPLQK